MTEKALRLGTRRSKLAMAQSGQVAEAVRQVTGRPVELVEITTYGDVSREALAQIGGTGVFVTALRDARCSRARSTSRFIRSRTCRPRSPRSWSWPPYRCARTRGT